MKREMSFVESKGTSYIRGNIQCYWIYYLIEICFFGDGSNEKRHRLVAGNVTVGWDACLFQTHISYLGNDIMTTKPNGMIFDIIYSASLPERIEMKLVLFIMGSNRWYNLPICVFKIRSVWVNCVILIPIQTKQTTLDYCWSMKNYVQIVRVLIYFFFELKYMIFC